MKAHRSFEGGYAERVRFAFWSPVDRHRLCPRDDKTDTDSQCTHSCHCEKDDSPTRQSTACNRRVQTKRFASRLTVDRHGPCSRHDKTGTDSQCTHFVIARRTIVRRGNPLHAKYANKQGGSLSGPQWIATGYALAMTRLIRTRSAPTYVIARRTIVRRGNPLHAIDAFRQNVSLSGSQWIATGCALAMTRIESRNKVGHAHPPQSFSYPLPYYLKQLSLFQLHL